MRNVRNGIRAFHRMQFEPLHFNLIHFRPRAISTHQNLNPMQYQPIFLMFSKILFANSDGFKVQRVEVVWMKV